MSTGVVELSANQEQVVLFTWLKRRVLICVRT